MKKSRVIIALCLLTLACFGGEGMSGDCPIAFTLSAPKGKTNLISMVLRAKYTNIGSRTVSVYESMRVSNGPLPSQKSSWFYWTRLLVSTGGQFSEVLALAPIIKGLPSAEPILLAPGESLEYSIPV